MNIFLQGNGVRTKAAGMPHSLSIVGTLMSAVGMVAVYGCVAGFLSTVLLLWVL